MKSNIFKRPTLIKDGIKSVGQTNGTVIRTIGTLTAKEVLDVDTTINSTIISATGTAINLTAEAVELLAKGLSTGFAQAHQWLDEVNMQLEADAQRAKDFADLRLVEADERTEAKLEQLFNNVVIENIQRVQRRIELKTSYENIVNELVVKLKADKPTVESVKKLELIISIYESEGINVDFLYPLYQNNQQQLP